MSFSITEFRTYRRSYYLFLEQVKCALCRGSWNTVDSGRGIAITFWDTNHSGEIRRERGDRFSGQGLSVAELREQMRLDANRGLISPTPMHASFVPLTPITARRVLPASRQWNPILFCDFQHHKSLIQLLLKIFSTKIFSR